MARESGLWSETAGATDMKPRNARKAIAIARCPSKYTSNHTAFSNIIST